MNKKNLIVIILSILGIAMIIFAIFLMGNKKDTITYEVTFDSKGGTLIEKQTIKKGEKVLKPNDPEKEGYFFMEWQLDGETFDFNTEITKDLVLEAEWMSLEGPIAGAIVKFNSDGGTPIPNQIVDKGETVDRPDDPEKEGYIFVEWQLDGETYDFTTEVNNNIVLKAVWRKLNNYTVTFNSDDGSAVPSQTIVEGNKATKPDDPTKKDYIFIEWQLNGKAYDFSTPVTKNITLKAKWMIKEIAVETFIVKFDSNGGTTISNQIVEKGKTVDKPDNPTKTGYTFVEWQLDGKPYDFSTPLTKDITLKAKWTQNKYTVTFDSDGGSSVANQTVIEGNKAQKPKNPTKAGYTFVEWQLDGKEYKFDTAVTKHITLKAVWEEIKTSYTVTFNSDGGSVVPSQTIVEGNKATKPDNPTKAGYTFVEWQLDGVTYGFDKPVTEKITLKAIWRELSKYTVTFNSDGGSSVPSQTIVEGNKATEPTDPEKEGYNFSGWTLNGNNYDFNTPVTGEITLVAKWTQKTYTVVAKKADLTAPFSRKLVVYEEGVEKTVKTIQYMDGVTLCQGTNPNVNYYAINEETQLKLVLNSGTVVIASLTIEI